jgi:multicomponent Na+:H+ antiporter subunit E
VSPYRRRTLQPLVLVWLLVVWLALWGDVSLFLVVTGLGVAVLACLAFPLPPLRTELVIRPWPTLKLLAGFVVDVVRASTQVALVVLRPRCRVRNAVVAVPLRTSSDVVLTTVAVLLSLVPGSVVVEARRSTHTLYLHVLDVHSDDEVEAFRADVLRLEERIVAAFAPTTSSTTAPTQQVTR